ncbi:MAG: transposase, partial [Eubacteriales bacterium]
KKYETKPELIGFTVEISYDPMNSETLTISHPNIKAFTANPLVIGSYCNQSSPLPISMQETEPETSRLLDALEQKHKETKERVTDGISFAAYRKVGESHV